MTTRTSLTPQNHATLISSGQLSGSLSLTVVPSASVLSPRDEQHALALLREAGYRGPEDELRSLARRAVQGSALIVRTGDTEPVEHAGVPDHAPMLTTLMAAV